LDGLTVASSLLQQQAIEKARTVFQKLPGGDTTFQQCVNHADSIPQIVESLLIQNKKNQTKQATRLLEKFEKYTLWLQGMSDAIDIVVQTQAGIGCPVWAPIKYVLMVVNQLVV
jgi:hypothetical protein